MTQLASWIPNWSLSSTTSFSAPLLGTQLVQYHGNCCEQRPGSVLFSKCQWEFSLPLVGCDCSSAVFRSIWILTMLVKPFSRGGLEHLLRW